MKNAKISRWKLILMSITNAQRSTSFFVFANENEMGKATGSWVKFLAHIQVQKTMIFHQRENESGLNSPSGGKKWETKFD